MASTIAYSSRTNGSSANAADDGRGDPRLAPRGAVTSSRCSGSGVVTGTDGGVPNSPWGRSASTIAITTNSATSVSFGNANVTPPKVTVPSAIHGALVRPISNAARNAPESSPVRRPP